MAWLIVILLSAAICGGAYYYWKGKQTQTVASGDAIKRNDDFTLQKHVFTTDIKSLDEIGNAMNSAKLAEHKISFEPGYANGKIVFHNNSASGSFGAALRDLGQADNGRHKYQFQLEAWRGDLKPSYSDYIAANVLLTEIERTLLRLDENTKIARTYLTYKTKTNFI